MQRMQWRLVWALLFTTLWLSLLMVSVAVAAPPHQDAPQPEADGQEDGQEYVVEAGDWLSTISQEFLGSSSAYTRIVEATNAKAESDPRYTPITDPDSIRVGQRLWIPAVGDETAAPISPTAVVSDAAGVVTATNTVTTTNSVTTTEAVTVVNGEVVSPSVRFVAPEDGAVVTSPFDVEMAAAGITVEPAGEIHPNAGHFHILVDTDFIAPGELIPFDEQHRHFGQGQLTTTLDLEPGVHTLRLQFADGAHIALAGAAYRDEITVTVSSQQAAQPNVYFVAPQDGAVVTSPVAVEMAAEGFAVEPAGEIHPNAGHFHILLDTDFIAPGELIPFDEQHLHFGQGQLTTTLDLEPGIHTLRLQAADGAHLAFESEAYRDQITVTVQAGE